MYFLCTSYFHALSPIHFTFVHCFFFIIFFFLCRFCVRRFVIIQLNVYDISQNVCAQCVRANRVCIENGAVLKSLTVFRPLNADYYCSVRFCFLFFVFFFFVACAAFVLHLLIHSLSVCTYHFMCGMIIQDNYNFVYSKCKCLNS